MKIKQIITLLSCLSLTGCSMLYELDKIMIDAPEKPALEAMVEYSHELHSVAILGYDAEEILSSFSLKEAYVLYDVNVFGDTTDEGRVFLNWSYKFEGMTFTEYYAASFRDNGDYIYDLVEISYDYFRESRGWSVDQPLDFEDVDESKVNSGFEYYLDNGYTSYQEF